MCTVHCLVSSIKDTRVSSFTHLLDCILNGIIADWKYCTQRQFVFIVQFIKINYFSIFKLLLSVIYCSYRFICPKLECKKYRGNDFLPPEIRSFTSRGRAIEQ